MPALALSAVGIGQIARHLRSSMLQQSRQEYVVYALAGGLSESAIVFWHAPRAAAVPVVTILGVLVSRLIGASVVVETLFNIPGAGAAAVQAADNKDLPVLQGFMLVLIVFVILVNAVVELLYGLPRQTHPRWGTDVTCELRIDVTEAASVHQQLVRGSHPPRRDTALVRALVAGSGPCGHRVHPVFALLYGDYRIRCNRTFSHTLSGPSAQHWLGTDNLGRDALSRLVYGVGALLLGALWATMLDAVIGLPIGVLAGDCGFFTDQCIMRVTDAVLAMPGIVFAVALIGLLGPSLFHAMTIVGIYLAPVMIRIARAQVLLVKQLDYVVITRSLQVRLVAHRLAPHPAEHHRPDRRPAAIFMALDLLAEASLSFLGYGVVPPAPSWGSMLATAQTVMSRRWQMLPPGIAILITAACFNLFGDKLTHRWDHSERAPRRRRAIPTVDAYTTSEEYE